jgi:hypothetical protein
VGDIARLGSKTKFLSQILPQLVSVSNTIQCSLFSVPMAPDLEHLVLPPVTHLSIWSGILLSLNFVLETTTSLILTQGRLFYIPQPTIKCSLEKYFTLLTKDLF